MAFGARSFFHCCSAGEDPGALLDRDNQVSEPWGEPEHGPCDTRRHGLAVFPRREGLYRYLAWKSDAGVEGKVVVELAGELSDDLDLDADHGALLVFPERLVAVEPLDPEVVASIRDRVGEEEE